MLRTRARGRPVRSSATSSASDSAGWCSAMLPANNAAADFDRATAKAMVSSMLWTDKAPNNIAALPLVCASAGGAAPTANFEQNATAL